MERTQREAKKAYDTGHEYELPDGEVIMVIDAIARQLGAVRRADGPSHKAIIVVNQQPGGVDRAEYVAQLIQNSGMQIVMGGGHSVPMRVAALHRGLGEAERHDIMARFHNRSLFDGRCLDALVVVSTLGEGYDFPLVSVVGILRAYQSLAPFYQYAGRAARRILSEHIGFHAVPLRDDNVAHVITHEWLSQRRWFSLLHTRQLVANADGQGQLNNSQQGVDAGFDREVQGQLPLPVAGAAAPAADLAQPALTRINVARLVLGPADPRYSTELLQALRPIHARWNVGQVQWAFHDE